MIPLLNIPPLLVIIRLYESELELSFLFNKQSRCTAPPSTSHTGGWSPFIICTACAISWIADAPMRVSSSSGPKE